jgi:hypothetical protein
LIISGVAGVVICLMASAIGNAVLVEISINIVFSAVINIMMIVVFWNMLYNYRSFIAYACK